MILDNQNRELCNKCNTLAIYNSEHGFYKCPACEHTWAYDKDDPDYLELEEVLEDCVRFHHGHCMDTGTTIEQSCSMCPRD